MSNIVWSAEHGWHDGPQVDSAAVVAAFTQRCKDCGGPLRIAFHTTDNYVSCARCGHVFSTEGA